jgi:hypothetical protein
MVNYKTTIAGVIGAIAMVLKLFKLDVPQEVLDGIVAIAVFAMGFFAKDAGVTGTAK